MFKKLLLCITLSITVSLAWGQNRISGTVTGADDGKPLSGASVLVQGTTQGSITDADGKYTVRAASDGILLVSYVGYQEIEIPINGRTTVDVSLQIEDVQMDDVVITALGMERSQRALQYSVTEVDGSSFTEAREVNLANSLAGKIAGVNASNLSTGPQGSSRVIIRGNVSLTGNNQPLYIVDGIPIDNSSFGQAGLWGGRDEGDGTSSINPDDIETISVLKGANAAALYGSRASNGVILITTKSGKSRKGLGIEFNSNFVFDTPIDLFDFQQEYGQGRDGRAPVDRQEAWGQAQGNWGGRLDPSVQTEHYDGVRRPYVYLFDQNMDNFYRTGTTWTNTIGFSGGNQDHAIRLNASILDNQSIQPNSGYKRRNVSTSYNGKFGNAVTVTSKILYSNEDSKNRPRISDSPGNSFNALLTLPYNYDVNDLRGDENKLGSVPVGVTTLDNKAPGEELQTSNNLWNANPWWAAYQFEDSDIRDRVITSNVVKIDITDFLFVQGRAGMDWYTRREREVTPYGTGYQRRGSMNERERRVREVNLEAMVGFDDNFGDISVNAFVAANRMRRSSETLSLSGGNFNIPFFHTVSNLANQSIGYGFSEEGINSVFGSVSAGFRDYLFLTATARQDWFSTLEPENNTILYPSVGASLVFTEMLGINSGPLTFGKLRASWAQVGGDTDPYRLLLTYGLGQGHLGQPNANIQQSSIPNSALIPLTSTEFEIGVDLRFLNNRLGLDFTYYNQRTTDDILNATISATSGFSSTTINIGEMRNSGVEVLLTGRPIQKRDFNWDVSFNFAVNNNEVVALSEGITEIANSGNLGIPRTRWVQIFNVVGEPYSTIKGQTQQFINGQPVFDPDNGLPVVNSEFTSLGNGVHRVTGGITNSFNFKGLYVDFLVDFKTGGDLYSGSNVRLVGDGFHKMTVENVSGPGFVSEGRDKITITGVDPNGESLSMVLDAEDTDDFWGRYSQLSDRFMYDATFAKLRQVSLGYSIPKSMLGSLPINTIRLSFVGRNLAILHSNVDNIDPESGFNNSNAQGIDYFSMPQTRSWGFNLKVDF